VGVGERDQRYYKCSRTSTVIALTVFLHTVTTKHLGEQILQTFDSTKFKASTLMTWLLYTCDHNVGSITHETERARY